MQATWARGDVQLYLGNCLEVLAELEAGSAQWVYADPPYNIGKAAWDKIEDYGLWCEEWIGACSRVLAPNGAFWVSHSVPEVLVDISRTIAQHGRKRINWITWDKYNGESASKGFLEGYTVLGDLRSFQQMAEYLVFHADDGQWERACGKLWSGEFEERRGFIFEPLRAYLDGERRRAGVDKAACNEACGFSRTAGGMASRHYFSRSQWCLPTREHYESLRALFNATGNNGGGHLRREYEDLRREYESLRYTFHNPGRVSSVWQVGPATPNGHPTPKPVELIRRMMLATTNPGDLCLAPFAGSFPTGEVAIQEKRRAIGIEMDQGSFELAKARMKGVLREQAEELPFALEKLDEGGGGEA